ncbi:AlpA family phage regulatory protein [Streptomyces sp. NPDC051987]|uniref:helix-turn-helix transcriptional regulator n=1 Tax=Streptomyces sp. NPDC051987 TaxID=3155808 RepID=UPI00342D4632
MITLKQIEQEHGVSRSALHTYRRSASFPQPVPVEGSTKTQYRADEVAAWFAANPKQQGKRTDLAEKQQGEPAMAEQQLKGEAGESSARDNLYEMATVAWQGNVPPPVHASVTLMLDIHEAETAEALAEKLRGSGQGAAADLIDPRVTEDWRP